MSLCVWGMGKNGQLGRGVQENTEIPDFCTIGTKRVVSVDAGGLYTAVVTDDGLVSCAGSGRHGRLGSGNEEDCAYLQVVRGLSGHKIIQVSCGIWHGAALSAEGQLYMWGYSKAHGVLGLEHHAPYAPPVHLPLHPRRVAGVSCGNNYTLAWTTEGELLSWGCGRYGVLGHGLQEDCFQPTPIAVPSGPVSHADAGFAHSGLVTTNGEVYMMGMGKYGALGLGKKKLDAVSTPQRVITPEGVKLKELSCSKGEHHGHTLAVTDTGAVYTWGDGYKGKLGLGDQESHYDPTPIPAEAFNMETVEHVSAGGIHSAAVTREGRVYTWGCGSDGRLGHPEAKGHRYLFRSDTPRLVEEITKYGHAVDVKASYYHTVAIMNKKIK